MSRTPIAPPKASMSIHCGAAALSAALLLGCGGGDTPRATRQVADTGAPDAEAPDSALPDPWAQDAPVPDAEAKDAAVPDAAVPVIVDPGPLPLHVEGTTVDGASRYGRYGCAVEVDAGGPEVVYRVVAERAGFLAATLAGAQGLAVHLLSVDDPGPCLARGDRHAAAWVEPGTYFVAVDTLPPAAPGAYALDVALTAPADLAAEGVEPTVAAAALRAFTRAWAQADTDRLEYAIVDFSRPSAERREWIFDLAAGTLLWNLYVTHGQGSSDPRDPGRAATFSNVPESHQSSLGLMRSAETYVGDYGRSFRLDGLEPGYNDLVRPRDIVMHPWEEARPEAIAANGGYLTESWGCPAIDDRVAPEVIDRMAGGALYFFWYPDGDWSAASTYLR